MAYCEDYPCCGHTPEDPCERQWYDEPGAFDPRVDPHVFCEHEVGICEVDYDDDDEFPELTECPEGCTGVEITDEGSSTGFSGAAIYWTTYSCGHQDVDDTADNLSAVE